MNKLINLIGFVSMTALTGLAFADITPFNLNNQTGGALNTACSPSSHFSSCTPDSIQIPVVINTFQSSVTISTASANAFSSQIVCTVNLEDKQTCAHGGCGYHVNVVGETAGNGYLCMLNNGNLTVMQS